MIIALLVICTMTLIFIVILDHWRDEDMVEIKNTLQVILDKLEEK